MGRGVEAALDAREQTSPRHLGLRLASAFVVGFVGLSLEIAYTRVISFKIFYYYTYFVIGLALLGLGAASSALALSSRLRRTDTLQLVRVASPLAGLVGAIAYVIVARMGTDTNLIWAGSQGEALEQLVRLLVIAVSLTMVFFGVGLVLARLIVAEAHEVRRLYFWDLTGAALGCLTAVPLQLTIGPPTMILTSSALLVLLGLVIALRTGARWKPSFVGVAVVALIATLAAGTFDVRTDDAKPSGTVTSWRPATGGPSSASTPSSWGSSTCSTTMGCGARRSGATTAPASTTRDSTMTAARSRLPRSGASRNGFSSSARPGGTRSRQPSPTASDTSTRWSSTL